MLIHSSSRVVKNDLIGNYAVTTKTFAEDDSVVISTDWDSFTIRERASFSKLRNVNPRSSEETFSLRLSRNRFDANGEREDDFQNFSEAIYLNREQARAFVRMILDQLA